MCNREYTGADCSVKKCPNNCTDNGICKNEICYCKPGFLGRDCSINSCKNNCNGNGKCVSVGKCVCDLGFKGEDCRQKCVPKTVLAMENVSKMNVSVLLDF